MDQQLPPEENCPRLGLGLGSRLVLFLGLEVTRHLGLVFGLGLVLGLEGNFRGRRAIVLETFCNANW